VIRVLIVLFWLSLLIGTLLAHNLIATWAVTLAGLYFLARWWSHRSRQRGPRTAIEPAVRMTPARAQARRRQPVRRPSRPSHARAGLSIGSMPPSSAGADD
jgi:hypothetical protein